MTSIIILLFCDQDKACCWHLSARVWLKNRTNEHKHRYTVIRETLSLGAGEGTVHVEKLFKHEFGFILRSFVYCDKISGWAMNLKTWYYLIEKNLISFRILLIPFQCFIHIFMEHMAACLSLFMSWNWRISLWLPHRPYPSNSTSWSVCKTAQMNRTLFMLALLCAGYKRFIVRWIKKIRISKRTGFSAVTAGKSRV